ncbi:MAG: hypothetical protein LQ340_007459 [Diploschistes diacapsis]|nr:MAG: hypothetical protein LQ340_007459 [Diploschistes diacapsis]
MRFSTIATATGLVLGATVGASYSDKYLDSLDARDLDDSLYARDYDEPLHARDYYDESLYARDYDEPLHARDAEVQSILYARDLVNDAVEMLMRRGDKVLRDAGHSGSKVTADPLPKNPDSKSSTSKSTGSPFVDVVQSAMKSQKGLSVKNRNDRP